MAMSVQKCQPPMERQRPKSHNRRNAGFAGAPEDGEGHHEGKNNENWEPTFFSMHTFYLLYVSMLYVFI